MKHSFLIFFILNLLDITAQDFDSLVGVSEKMANDTSRVTLFYSEGFTHRNNDIQYSYDCAKEAEDFAKKSGLPFYMAKANNLLGILYYRKGDLTTALNYHKKALQQRLRINDKRGVAQSQVNLGNIYSELARYKPAETAYLLALAINNELQLQQQVDNCLLNLGVLNTELKNTTAAENYFNQAFKNAEKRFDYDLQAQCLNNLAVINIGKENYDAAIANSINSLKLKNLMDNEMEMADSYLNLAVAYIQKKEALPALQNLVIADSIILKYNYLAAKIEALKVFAQYYQLEKNYEKAFEHLQKYYYLKDSLSQATKEIEAFGFIETGLKKLKPAEAIFVFPWLYFNILLFLIIGSAVFILKHKR